jgi:hypothetical protein
LATFDLFALRFHLVARHRISFPAAAASNLLRGGFGAVFKKMPHVYEKLFTPAATAGPSGLRDLPRPFVFRAAHLDGATVLPGETFDFGLNLFEMREDVIDLFATAFAERFGSIDRIEGRHPVHLPMEPAELASAVRIKFVTPTELKGADRPEFTVLFARIRDRISTLRARYGDGPLAIDFKSIGERAASITMTRCEIHHVDAERTSRRTGQTHSLAGFLGEADYQGHLTEFIPYLEIARWTGVGRQTVWGKGEIAWEIL